MKRPCQTDIRPQGFRGYRRQALGRVQPLVPSDLRLSLSRPCFLRPRSRYKVTSRGKRGLDLVETSREIGEPKLISGGDDDRCQLAVAFTGNRQSKFIQKFRRISTVESDRNFCGIAGRLSPRDSCRSLISGPARISIQGELESSML